MFLPDHVQVICREFRFIDTVYRLKVNGFDKYPCMEKVPKNEINRKAVNESQKT